MQEGQSQGTDHSVFAGSGSKSRFQFHKLFHRINPFSPGPRKLNFLRYLPPETYSDSCIPVRYSSGATPPSARDSNRVQCFKNAIRTLPIGPFRCLEMMISALPCNSGSSCL